jgi:CheY-like chemotaxis protein
MAVDSETAAPTRLPRLLVVDDEPGNLFTFKRVLRLVYDVTLASSAAQALDALERASAATSFDVLLVDYGMPVMNGADLLMKVRLDHPDLPCIFLTAYAELEEVKAAARKYGVVAIIMKPWERADVEHWVDHSIRIARMKRSVVGSR